MGSNFYGGKLPPGEMPPENCPLSPKKKKRKRRKLTPEKITSYVNCKGKRRYDKKID